jgi:tRNA(Ile)-lysidine synthase
MVGGNMNQANKILNDVLNDNDVLVIGVSGGPDSMGLLNLVVNLPLNLKIICAHVNHNLRRESFDEEIMVENFCKEHNVIFHKMLINEYSNDNFHNDARKKRYDFYEELINEYGAKYLLTAHHGDDLMETMLMRMVRGSTLSGYSSFGFLEERGNYFILRPLIHNTKAEILDYVLLNKIPYAIDASNEKDVYTRNRFRKYILPVLKNENKNVHNKFYDFSVELKEANDLIQSLTLEKLNECYSNGILNFNFFSRYHIALKRNILRKILKDIYEDELYLITDKHIDEILSLKKPNCILYLPKNIILSKSYDNITFSSYKKTDKYCYEFRNKIVLPNGKVLEVSKNVNEKSNFVIRLDSSELQMPLIVRTRKDGDKIILKGLNKEKKIKDIFIDEKIPLKSRDIVPIVCDSSGNIIWVPGIKKSKFDKEKDEKYDIIIKYS